MSNISFYFLLYFVKTLQFFDCHQQHPALVTGWHRFRAQGMLGMGTLQAKAINMKRDWINTPWRVPSFYACAS